MKPVKRDGVCFIMWSAIKGFYRDKWRDVRFQCHELSNMNEGDIFFDKIYGEEGVYGFFSDKREPLYIGTSKYLEARIRYHIETEMPWTWGRYVGVILYQQGQKKKRYRDESFLIQALKPKFNNQGWISIQGIYQGRLSK